MDMLIISVLIVVFIGFTVYRIMRKRKKDDLNPIGDTPPPILKGVSPHYILWNKNYRDLIDMVVRYRGNMIRVFTYGSPDWHIPDLADWWPWNGDRIDNLDPDKVGLMKEVVKYASDRGVWIILVLFHVNSRWSYEQVLRRPIGEISNYIKQFVEMFPRGVIFQTCNEMGDMRQQRWILDRIREYGGKYTCTYSTPHETVELGATYILRHGRESDRDYFGGGVIQSNDTPGAIEYLSDEDYIRIMDGVRSSGRGGFEWLMAWGRGECEPGKYLPASQDIEHCWRKVLEHIRNI